MWKFLIADPTEYSHCIISHDEYGARVVLPLVLQGITSALNVHHVSDAGWTQEAAPRITMTNRDLRWDPNSSIYEEQEHACSDLFGGLLTRLASAGNRP